MFVTAGLPSTLSLISLNRTAREFSAFNISTPCSGLGNDILLIALWVSTYFLRASVSITGIGRAGMLQLHLQLHGFGWDGLFGHVTGFWLGVALAEFEAQVDFGIDSGLVTPIVAVVKCSVTCWVGFSIFFSFIESDKSELDDEIEDSFSELVLEWLRFNLFNAGGAFGFCSAACWGSVFWTGLVGRDGRFLFFLELTILPSGVKALFFVFSSVFFLRRSRIIISDVFVVVGFFTPFLSLILLDFLLLLILEISRI